MMAHFPTAPVTASDSPSPSQASGANKHAGPAPPTASAALARASSGQNAALRVIDVDIAANGMGAARYSTRSSLDSSRGGDLYRPATTGAGEPRWRAPSRTRSVGPRRVLGPSAAPCGSVAPGRVTEPAPFKPLLLLRLGLEEEGGGKGTVQLERDFCFARERSVGFAVLLGVLS